MEGGFTTMKKQLLTAFLALVVLVLGAVAVSAENFVITAVQVDDIPVSEGGQAVHVERGQDAIVEVFLTGLSETDDVRVKAYIGGYEYDDVEALSDIFEVEPGVKYKKTLRLAIPEDLSASDDKTLRVKVYDDDDEIEQEFTLRIKEQRHDVVIQDVIIRPSDSVEAGRPLFVTVRAENLGSRKEEDIRVSVSIPELGVSARDYIDELAANEDRDDGEDNEDEESSASSDELLLRIPEDAETGDYDLLVSVEYNRGHSLINEKHLIHVEGMETDNEPTPGTPPVGTTDDEKSVISVDSSSKTAKGGEEVAYKIMIANMGSKSKLYTVEVAGEQLFAEATIDPAFVNIPADSTGEVFVYVTPKEGAEEGRHSFTARVKSGDELVDELSLTTNVENAKRFGGDLKQALVIGLIVLVVILIILGLIVAFSRMRGDDEPGVGEGQNYYYYPKY